MIFDVVNGEDFDVNLRLNKDAFLKLSNFQTENRVLEDFIFPLSIDQNDVENFISKKEEQKKKLGWSYTIKKGETLWEISKKFKIPLKDLLAINSFSENSIIKAGDKIVIPGVKPQGVIVTEKPKELVGKFVSALKEVGNIVIPVSGFNWGHNHGDNGTDIAAQCGQEVYAANSGIVIESRDGWNGGYGNYIIIKHSNGIYSLYGHLSLRLVQIGEKVNKGELIGYVGNTGYTLGPTGCHLHFEIRGGANPLLR